MITPTQIEQEGRTLSLEGKLRAFKNQVIMHPIFGSKLKTILAAVTGVVRPGLIQVFGPAGVGKSELGNQIVKRLSEHYSDKLRENPGALPAVRIVVPPPIDSTFDFRSYYREALREFSEPLLNRKERSAETAELSEYEKRQLLRTGWELRDAFESCVKHRTTQVVINDEAQHFNKVRGARRLIDHMDTMKTLADKTGAVFVMLGTYELLDALEVSGQLARRSKAIHFTRYHADVAESARAFKSVLNTVQNHLPLPSSIVFVDHWEYFFRKSLGLVGRLMDQLNVALSAAIQDGGDRLTWDHLKRAEPSNAELRKLLVEIEEGEQRRAQEDSLDAEFARRLGLPSVGIADGEELPTGEKKCRPGERAPTRDKVGQ